MAAIKGSRGGRTSGSTGIGPGGGAFGGAGGSFLGGGGQSFGGDMMSNRRKFIQGANGQLPVSYTPLKNPPASPDNVPAMLSQGEYVVNNRAMQLPGAQEFVSMLNAAGNGGRYAEGGQVIDMDMLVRLLSALSSFANGGESEGEDGGGDGGQCPDCGGEHGPGMACGGPVKRYAWGGMVQGQQGGFRQQGLGTPRMPSQPFAGGRMAPRPSMGGGQPTGQPRAPQAPVGAPVMMPNTGNVTPQMSVPGGQWQFGPGFGGSGDTTGANGGIQSLYDLLNQYGQTGMFGPEGNPAMMRAVQEQATSNADAMRARQQNALQLGGMDPGQAAAMRQMGDLRGQGDVANALNAAQLGQLQAQDQFGRDLFKNVTGFNQDAWKAWNDYVHQARLGG